MPSCDCIRIKQIGKHHRLVPAEGPLFARSSCYVAVQFFGISDISSETYSWAC